MCGAPFYALPLHVLLSHPYATAFTPPRTHACHAVAPRMQKLQAAAVQGVEERRRLEAQYTERLVGVERRVKELAEKERAYRRSAAQLVRSFAQLEACCGVLQARGGVPERTGPAWGAAWFGH
jgi:hypothetical protein